MSAGRPLPAGPSTALDHWEAPARREVQEPLMIERDGREALDELYWRAEILQALYWMRGEGLATEVEPAALAGFLVADPATLADQMRRLASDGYLTAVEGEPVRYRLTPLGIAEGGRSFRDEFEGLTRQAHGECGPGCWCKDPNHDGEPCPNQPKEASSAA